MQPSNPSRQPPAWAILLGFAAIYITWGTTYLPIRIGVHDEGIPPLLFGGTRIGIAGVVLLLFQVLRGQSARLAPGEFLPIVGVSWLLFVGGNGMINTAGKTVASGTSAVLVATTPLWLGLFAMAWPRGERLTPRGWLGLVIGVLGVMVLLWEKQPSEFARDFGPLLVLGSAASWALGSLVLRHLRIRTPHLTAAAYQMIIGGLSLCLLGTILGEPAQLPERVTPGAAGAFFYLLFVGSLMGFVAFNWLLSHVSAAKVGTYAYVNPAVAVVVGCVIGGEPFSGYLAGGICVILLGVFLVRGGESPTQIAVAAESSDPAVAEPSDWKCAAEVAAETRMEHG